MSARRRPHLHALLLALVSTLVLSGLSSPAASAAGRAPQGLTPSGESLDGSPVLTWDRVAGATSYNVQVSATSDFAALSYKTSTTNHRVVPNVQLPPGEVWWRVQAVGGSGTSDWSTTTFDRSRIAGPALDSPADGELLDQPEHPALLSWSPVPGATGYTIEIDDAEDFIGATRYTTKTSSYVVPNPQVATDYHWHVQATLASGVVTDWSEARTYSLGGLDRPVLVGPADSALTSVEDVVLDWRPVKGAATYDLQVSTDETFQTFEDEVNGIKGTRFSPPETYDNDQYFWRVRPVDTLGNKLAWNQVDTWEFRHHWPDQPVLEHPAQDDVVGDPFYYQWTPVDKAGEYEVQISTSSTFQTVADTCRTVHTTYVPTGKGDCWPGAAGTYYWRVLAVDTHDEHDVVDSDLISAQVGRFSYLPQMVDLGSASPADGSTVQVPTLTWDPVPGAAKYKVFITATDGGSNSVNGTTTAATSFTPRKALTPGKTYRWWIQTLSLSDRAGAGLAPEDQNTFTVATPATPVASVPDQLSPADNAQFSRFPTMTWEPVVGAAYYKIGLRPAASVQNFTLLPDEFTYPAGEDLTTTWLSPGSYQWVVSAYDSSDVKLSTSSTARRIRFVDLPSTAQPRAGMTGSAVALPSSSCTAVLPDRCEDLRQTPVLRWAPVTGASGYRVYLSHDAEMTNLLSNFPVSVDTNMWMSRSALIDSQAGDAFYWQVEPCQASGVCRPLEHAGWAFNKKSNPVELTSPADSATVGNDITFTWRDYLETNSDPAYADDETGEQSRTEAMQYRVEVSSVPNFQSLLDSAEVDQTTYTAYGKTYPEGIVYWRVTALDGSGNRVGTSDVSTFTKSSPVPSLASPTDNVEVSQTEPFRWAPLDFADSYDVEVYKNNDTVGQSANRVVSGTSRQVAFTTTTPLAPSDTPYRWRIRRVDASGNKGAWTDLSSPEAQFRVVGTEPTLLTPEAGSYLVGDDALFSWQGVDRASSYRFERRAAGATSVAEVVNTPALAWAPTKTIAEGSWEWRVSTLDAAGKVMRSSAWRAFKVDSTRPTVTRKSPTGRVDRSSSFVATFSERVTGVSTTTMRLYLKGSPDPVPATVRLNRTGRKATLDPRANLRAGRTYTVKLTKAITDGAGNRLVPATWKVTTR